MSDGVVYFIGVLGCVLICSCFGIGMYIIYKKEQQNSYVNDGKNDMIQPNIIQAKSNDTINENNMNHNTNDGDNVIQDGYQHTTGLSVELGPMNMNRIQSHSHNISVHIPQNNQNNMDNPIHTSNNVDMIDAMVKSMPEPEINDVNQTMGGEFELNNDDMSDDDNMDDYTTQGNIGSTLE